MARVLVELDVSKGLLANIDIVYGEHVINQRLDYLLRIQSSPKTSTKVSLLTKPYNFYPKGILFATLDWVDKENFTIEANNTIKKVKTSPILL